MNRKEIDNKVREIITDMIKLNSTVIKGYMFIDGKHYNYQFVIELETKHGETFSKLLKDNTKE